MKLTTDNGLRPAATTRMEDLDNAFPEAANTAKADEVLAQGRGERPAVEDLATWILSADCSADRH